MEFREGIAQARRDLFPHGASWYKQFLEQSQLFFEHHCLPDQRDESVSEEPTGLKECGATYFQWTMVNNVRVLEPYTYRDRRRVQEGPHHFLTVF